MQSKSDPIFIIINKYYLDDHVTQSEIVPSLPVLNNNIPYRQVNNQPSLVHPQEDIKSPLPSVGSSYGKQLGHISLEELVKIVVLAVKETESSAKHTEEKAETHEEIHMLVRKRKQVNAQ